MVIKTKHRLYQLPVRMCGAIELSNITNTKWKSHLKSSLAISTKVNICLPCHPEIPLLHKYSCKIKIYVHRKTLTWMFIVLLFIVAKNWQQSKCLCFRCFWVTLDRVVILPNFPRNRRTTPHSGDTMVHPRQRGTRVPISTHPARPFSSCFSFVWFLKVTILRGVRWHLTGFFPFSHD